MHSRASADIEQILDNGGTGDDRDSLWIADVLDLWGKKVVACTVDSVLSLLACWRRALAATPVFAQSAFVFDEVHSYDQHLFGAFLAFLRWTRAPCLVMTASLSDVRRAAIEQACGKALEPIRGEPTMEGAARYRIAQVGSEEVLGHVEEAARVAVRSYTSRIQSRVRSRRSTIWLRRGVQVVLGSTTVVSSTTTECASKVKC